MHPTHLTVIETTLEHALVDSTAMMHPTHLTVIETDVGQDSQNEAYKMHPTYLTVIETEVILWHRLHHRDASHAPYGD